MTTEVLLAETPAHVEEIQRLRYEIYIEEMRYQYSNADHAKRLLGDPLDDTARLLLARIDGRCAGTMRLHLGKDGPLAQELTETLDLDRFRVVVGDAGLSVLTRFMVRSDLRSATLTQDLFDRYAKINVDEGVEVIALDCQPHLVNFYAGLGFRPGGRLINDAVAGVLVPMVLLTSDLPHLERVKSRLLPIFRKKTPRPELVDRLLPLLPAAPGITSEGADPETFWSEVSGLISELTKAKASIFAGLPEPTVQAILAKSHVLDVKEGDYIIRRGLVTRTVFVVLSGVLEVRDGTRILAVATEGEVIGEVAFLLEGKRTSDVRAVGKQGARVLCLNERILRTIVDTDPRGAALLLLNLSKALATKLCFMTIGQLRP